MVIEPEGCPTDSSKMESMETQSGAFHTDESNDVTPPNYLLSSNVFLLLHRAKRSKKKRKIKDDPGASSENSDRGSNTSINVPKDEDPGDVLIDSE